jgi:hypothetical protein
MTRPDGQSAGSRLPFGAKAGLVLIGLSSISILVLPHHLLAAVPWLIGMALVMLSRPVRIGEKVAAALVGIVPIVSAFTYVIATCVSDTTSAAGGRVLSHSGSCSQPTSLVGNVETWTTSPLSMAILLVPMVVAYILFVRVSRRRLPQL